MSSKRPAPVKRAGRTLKARDKYGPAVISITSVLIVVFLLRTVIVHAQQWPRIKAQFFSLDAIIEVFPNVLKGFGLNMSIWAVSLVVIALWALMLAVFRSLHGPWFAPLKVFSIVYIDLFRGFRLFCWYCSSDSEYLHYRFPDCLEAACSGVLQPLS